MKMARTPVKAPAYTNLDEFVYGHAKNPVKLKNGMVIGGGTIYPELNFTVPTMKLIDSTWADAVECYREIITKTCIRAHQLEVPGFVAEIETLPEMTFKPKWAIEICKLVVDIIKEHESKYGIKGAVRITPNDNREGDAVEHMFRGPRWDETMEAFEGSGKAGADFFSIETCGGKEAHDDALMFCDLHQDVFAYAGPACHDMEKIWTNIVAIAAKYPGTVAAGDTACGLANTAMVLAEQGYIPRVFAAVDRVMASVRSLVAQEVGCKGPDKDCGYEGPYVKAASGNPISMEGRVASCAHLSACGNIAVCVADLWSNESVQNIQLLSGIAPVASFETLAYDCRLMNQATKVGHNKIVRDLNADSDSYLDPHAYILRPDVVLDITKGILAAGEDYYARTKAAAQLTTAALDKAAKDGKLRLIDREKEALKKLLDEAGSLPATLDDLAKEVLPDIKENGKFDPKKYDLPY
jgi:methanol--5-hydroxybenzimidazolylcobamide Co-methyltransferase